MLRRLVSWTSAWLLIACQPAEQKNRPIDAAKAVADLIEEAPWISDTLGIRTYVFFRPLKEPHAGETASFGERKQVLVDLERSSDCLVEVVAHELGHAMGLDHNEADPQSIMYPVVPRLSGVRAAVDSLAAECASQSVGCKRLSVLVELGSGSSR